MLTAARTWGLKWVKVEEEAHGDKSLGVCWKRFD